jgi:hypothetical protein
MEDQGQNDELYPIAVLIDELKVGLVQLALSFKPGDGYAWTISVHCDHTN